MSVRVIGGVTCRDGCVAEVCADTVCAAARGGVNASSASVFAMSSSARTGSGGRNDSDGNRYSPGGSWTGAAAGSSAERDGAVPVSAMWGVLLSSDTTTRCAGAVAAAAASWAKACCKKAGGIAEGRTACVTVSVFAR